MHVKVGKEPSYEVTLHLRPWEAQEIIRDYNQTKEPSSPGKALYEALMGIANKGTENV